MSHITVLGKRAENNNRICISASKEGVWIGIDHKSDRARMNSFIFSAKEAKHIAEALNAAAELNQQVVGLRSAREKNDE